MAALRALDPWLLTYKQSRAIGFDELRCVDFRFPRYFWVTMADYGGWTVARLKNELSSRGASVRGRKRELIER